MRDPINRLSGANRARSPFAISRLNSRFVASVAAFGSSRGIGASPGIAMRCGEISIVAGTRMSSLARSYSSRNAETRPIGMPRNSTGVPIAIPCNGPGNDT